MLKCKYCLGGFASVSSCFLGPGEAFHSCRCVFFLWCGGEDVVHSYCVHARMCLVYVPPSLRLPFFYVPWLRWCLVYPRCCTADAHTGTLTRTHIHNHTHIHFHTLTLKHTHTPLRHTHTPHRHLRHIHNTHTHMHAHSTPRTYTHIHTHTALLNQSVAELLLPFTGLSNYHQTKSTGHQTENGSFEW